MPVQVLVWHENLPIAVEVLWPDDMAVVLSPGRERWWARAPGSEARLRTRLLEARGVQHLVITPAQWFACHGGRAGRAGDGGGEDEEEEEEDRGPAGPAAADLAALLTQLLRQTVVRAAASGAGSPPLI